MPPTPLHASHMPMDPFHKSRLTVDSKVFKTGNALKGHLNGTYHGDTKYQCPACHRIFKSLTAITQHAEASGAKCHLRESSDYNAYMDQLTAGLVDVALDRHEDGTIKFQTSEAATQVLLGARVNDDEETKTVSMANSHSDDRVRDEWNLVNVEDKVVDVKTGYHW